MVFFSISLPCSKFSVKLIFVNVVFVLFFVFLARLHFVRSKNFVVALGGGGEKGGVCECAYQTASRVGFCGSLCQRMIRQSERERGLWSFLVLEPCLCCATKRRKKSAVVIWKNCCKTNLSPCHEMLTATAVLSCPSTTEIQICWLMLRCVERSGHCAFVLAMRGLRDHSNGIVKKAHSSRHSALCDMSKIVQSLRCTECCREKKCLVSKNSICE